YAVLGRRSALDAHEDRHGRAGVVVEESLEHGLPDEAGRSGEEDLRVAEGGGRLLGGHGTSLPATRGPRGASPGRPAIEAASWEARAAPSVPPNTRFSKKVRSSAGRSVAPTGQAVCRTVVAARRRARADSASRRWASSA